MACTTPSADEAPTACRSGLSVAGADTGLVEIDALLLKDVQQMGNGAARAAAAARAARRHP
jgi:hypothetical protein